MAEVRVEESHSSEDNLDVLIRRYFEDDYTHDEIRSFLSLRHGVEWTPDQLRRRLRIMGLRRRGADIESSLEDVQEAVIVSIKSQ